MAEIIQQEQGSGGKKRVRKGAAHVDMTPMVDLICLLLTFFILTAAFNKPKIMTINMPDKQAVAQNVIKDRMLNVLLGDNGRVFYYMGMIEEGEPLPSLTESDYSKDGIRRILLQMNRDLFTRITEYNEVRLTGRNRDADSVSVRKIREWKTDDYNSPDGGPTVLIKAAAESTYKDLVNMVNEMAITNIAVYAIVDIAEQEIEMLATATGGSAP
jgi:biopolymer transport protein ExbD